MADPICRRCEEPITAADRKSPARLDGNAMHYECGLRIVIGSVGHLRKECWCFGGTSEDPEGMTKREAARAAVDLWAAIAMEEAGS